MRLKKAVSLLMTLMMVIAALSFPAMATDTPGEAIDPPAQVNDPPAEATEPPSEATDECTDQSASTTSLFPPHYLWLSYNDEQGSIEVAPEGPYFSGNYWYYWMFVPTPM